MEYDVVIIGGGPAGLSAALLLGRCNRAVLLLDSNEPRNGASPGLHGYLTRDGVAPLDLRALGRADVLRYPGVLIRETKATAARRDRKGFEVTLENRETLRARLLLLATGRVDPVPRLPGFARFFGHGVYHCPYCDGWEHRGGRLGVFGDGPGARDLAGLLLTWSRDVTIYAGGPPRWRETGAPPAPIRVLTHTIARLEGGPERLARVVFADGTAQACEALFFCTACPQRSSLPEQLGCQFDEDDSVLCEGHGARGVPGLFVAGNVRGGVHLAITAAAEGAEAAIAMNEALLDSPAG